MKLFSNGANHSKCFEEDPTNYTLLSMKCALRSTHGKKLTSYEAVCWKEGRFHKIRPVPEDFEGLFALCNFGPKCKGENCTYAHSEVEKVLEFQLGETW